SMSERGRLGGLATFRQYGKAHMAAIGKRGFEATVARHWQGDRLAYRLFLAARNWNLVTDALAGRELDRQLQAGAVIASVELPWVEHYPESRSLGLPERFVLVEFIPKRNARPDGLGQPGWSPIARARVEALVGRPID